MSYRDPDLSRVIEDLRHERKNLQQFFEDERFRAVPKVVEQALDDTALPAAARLLMWHLRRRLDTQKYREQSLDSLVSESGFGKSTISEALARLTAEGYLDVRGLERRSRAYRLPVSRRVGREIEAA